MAGSITERLAILIDADGKAAVREFQKVGQAAERELGKAESTAAKVGGTLTKVGAASLVAGSVMVAGLTKAAQSAGNLEQAVGGTEAVFGRASKVIDDYAKGSAESMGLSERAFRESTTRLGGALKGLGFDTQVAADQSVKLTQLAADLAATYGGTTADAVQALGAAFRGEFDPAEQFNLFLKQSAVDAEAVRLGLASSTASVDAHARAQATLSLIMKGSVDAQGQFGRESDTLNHKMQVLSAQLENSTAQLGQGFMPVLAKVAGFASDAATEFVKLDGATGGMASQLAAVGSVGLVAGGGLAFVAGQAIQSFGAIKSGVKDAVDGIQSFKQKISEARAEGQSFSQVVSNMSGSVLASTSIIGAGVIAITAWAKAKADARDRTLEFVQALKADNGAIGENTDKLIQNKVAQADLNDNLTQAGITYDQFVSALKNGGDEGERIIRQLMQRGKLTGEEKLRLGELLNAYGNATREMKQNEAAGIGLANSMTQAAAATATLASAAAAGVVTLEQLKDVMSRGFQITVGAADAQRGFQDAINGTTRATGTASSTSDDYASKLRRQEDATRAVSDAESELADAIDYRNQVLAGPDAETVEKAQIDLRRAQREVARTSIDAAKANDAYNQALNDGDPTKIAEAQLDYNEARDRFREAQLRVTDTQQRLNEIQNQGKEGSKEYADATDRVEQAQRRVEQAQRDAADATDNLNKKIGGGGGIASSFQSAAEQASNAAQKAQDWLNLMVNSDEPAGVVLQTIQGIRDGFDQLEQKTPGTKGVLEDFWNTVIQKVKDYYDQLDRISKIDAGTDHFSPGGKVRDELNDYLHNIGVRASGGPVMAGGAYIVGERGPELYTPGASGMIHPTGSFGGLVSITVHAFSSDGVEEAVVSALKRAQRMGLTGLAA